VSRCDWVRCVGRVVFDNIHAAAIHVGRDADSSEFDVEVLSDKIFYSLDAGDAAEIGDVGTGDNTAGPLEYGFPWYGDSMVQRCRLRLSMEVL
jgi:hypothetical protein